MNRPTRSLFAATIAVAAVTCQRGETPQTTTTDSAAMVAGPTPDSFSVAFETNKGRIVVQAVRAWAPQGVDRFYALVNDKFYDGAKFFRVLPDFMAQFGINGTPSGNEAWKEKTIPDDPVAQSNLRGYVTFATGGPNTRTTQLFINKRDNKRLDAMGFAPFAKVVEGMAVVDSLNMEYGEGAPGGNGPAQDRINSEGNTYLNRYFPRLDSILTARVVR
jgi:peptidyl-prolyl cis-trans isomerase A (cyclophilin A)